MPGANAGHRRCQRGVSMRESEKSVRKIMMTVAIACAIAASLMPAGSADPAPEVQLTPQLVNDAQLTDTISQNARGAAVLRAQVLLDRAHFAPGEMAAVFGAAPR